jgi:hypothetical protein
MPALETKETVHQYHRILIISSGGIPLFFRSRDSSSDDFIPLSAFFGGIQNFSKGFHDKIQEIIFSQIKYLLYPSQKFVIILGVDKASTYEEWLQVLKDIETRFYEKFDSMLNEIGQFSGKLSAFEIFNKEFNTILPHSPSSSKTTPSKSSVLGPIDSSSTFKEIFIM